MSKRFLCLNCHKVVLSLGLLDLGGQLSSVGSKSKPSNNEGTQTNRSKYVLQSKYLLG